MSAQVDVLAVIGTLASIVRADNGNKHPEITELLGEASKTIDAVAELIAACEARDVVGPSWSDVTVNCFGDLSRKADTYDATQARYRAALARCKGKSP